jgi:dolichol-phosphate mannosyltransferase
LKVFVVIPTFNESDNVVELTDRMMKIEDTNVVFVDDNSPDGTGLVEDGLSKKYEGRIHVIHRSERGRGTATIEGFKYCLGEHADRIIKLDADLSHPPELIPSMLEASLSYSVVIASKHIKGGSNKDSKIRNLISNGGNLFARVFLGWSIKDWCGSYRCYRYEDLNSLNLDKFATKNHSINIETLYRLKLKGCSMTEIPYTFVKRSKGYSKFHSKEILSYIVTVLKLKLLNATGRL